MTESSQKKKQKTEWKNRSYCEMGALKSQIDLKGSSLPAICITTKDDGTGFFSLEENILISEDRARALTVFVDEYGHNKILIDCDIFQIKKESANVFSFRY